MYSNEKIIDFICPKCGFVERKYLPYHPVGELVSVIKLEAGSMCRSCGYMGYQKKNCYLRK